MSDKQWPLGDLPEELAYMSGQFKLGHATARLEAMEAFRTLIAERDALLAERERLREALKPFARVATTDTVELAQRGNGILTVSNGSKMFILYPHDFAAAKAALNAK